MLNRYSALILGTMLGLGTLAFSGAGASAAAMLSLSPPASGEAKAVNNGIIQVNHKKMAQETLQLSLLRRLVWRLPQLPSQ